MALKRFLTCALLSFALFFSGLFIGTRISKKPAPEQLLESNVSSIVPAIKSVTFGGTSMTQGEFEEMVLNKAYEDYGIDRDTFTKR